MIRLILLIIVILFFLWLISNLFLKDKKELDKKLKISKPLLLLGIIAGIVLFAFILPRFGLNPLFLIQKIAPFLSFLRGFIPF
tara:strand:- start:94 stop:342 length:249 start_codon:yes stop_codon:yes gene_type:complete